MLARPRKSLEKDRAVRPDAGLPAVAEQIAALLRERRPGLVVIDSFKALQPFASGPGEFRQFLHEVTGTLTAAPVTSLWVGEYSTEEIAAMPEFAVADAIVNLAVVRTGSRDLRLLHVGKIRGSGFLSGQHAYRLSSQGIHVFPRLADVPSQAAYTLGDVRVPSGIAALDEMIGNGYWPGASTLVAGPSGAGKTLMGLHFIMAGARQGEPGVIAALQEDPSQLQRMAGGFGWSLEGPPVDLMYRSPVDIYIDQWVYDLLDAVERTGARRVLVDSLMDLQYASRTVHQPEPVRPGHLPPVRQRHHPQPRRRPARPATIDGCHKDPRQQAQRIHPSIRHQCSRDHLHRAAALARPPR